MTESRIEKLTRIGQEMAAAVAEMRAEVVDLTPDLTTKLAIRQIEGEAEWWRSIDFDRNASRTFESMTGDSQQAVRTGVERVLAHLQSTNRLIPAGGITSTPEWIEMRDNAAGWQRRALKAEAALAGGMALTAEQVVALKRLMDAQPDEVPQGYDLLEALFPATEPAEEVYEPRMWGIDAPEPSDVRYVRDRYGCLFEKFADNVWHRWRASVGRFGEADWTWSELASDLPVEVLGTPLELAPPAPAEPADEETKADTTAIKRDAWFKGYDACRQGDQRHNPHPSSSPVVPAPNETGPWEDISEAPKHLTLIDRVGDKWTYDGDDWVTPETAILPVMSINKHYAPFVAAPTGTGPWQTWRDVPDGVSYRSSRPGSPLTFTNRNGVRFVNSTGMPDEFERLQPFNAVKEQS